jgi:ribA/ribD-fused uncharacterized protein
MKITDKYVFFWNGIYSQWHKAKMIIDGVEYSSCEQYMMHQKAIVFSDFYIASQILLTSDPKEQKSLGRKIQGFNKDVWDSVCLSIVYKGNLAKFSQNENLKADLLSTENRILVEASPLDKIWGIGMAEDHPDIESPEHWRGLNLLGWALNLVKQELNKK